MSTEDLVQTPVAHTATPWRYRFDEAHPKAFVVIDASNRNVCQIMGYHDLNPNVEANAAFIVEAVNSHDSLIAQRDALRAALDDLLGYAQMLAAEHTDPGVGALCAIHNAKAALALAGDTK